MNDLGTLVDDTTIRFERLLPAPVDRVWRAITDPDEMRAWFPSHVQGERKVGAPLRFPFDTNVADSFTGEVTEWSPPRVFAFTWNHDQLRIELTPAGEDRTTLVFTHRVYDRSIAARTAAGWHTCLANLVAAVGGPPAGDELWRTTYPDYLERMGPPLAERDGDALVYRRAHHLTPEQLQQRIDDGTWKTDPVPSTTTAWTFEPTAFGCRYALHVRGADAETAARWHGLLLQLDMFAASGQLMVDDDWRSRIADYDTLLS